MEALGERLQRLRKARGLSQRELARRAGMPNGSVSMIEQGRVSPSVASLEKLVAALPMTLAEFFGPGAGEQVVFRAAQAGLCLHNDYQVSIVAEFPGRFSRFIHARLTLKPGGRCAGEWLMGPALITAALLAGQVEIADGDHRSILGVGDVCRLFGRHGAHLVNVGEIPAELILWCELAPSESSRQVLAGAPDASPAAQ